MPTRCGGLTYVGGAALADVFLEAGRRPGALVREAAPGGVAPEWRYPGCMPSVQIKNVPPDVHGVLRRRAALAGKSLQQYLLEQLTKDARRPTLDELFQDRTERSGGSMPLEFAVEAVREDRDSR